MKHNFLSRICSVMLVFSMIFALVACGNEDKTTSTSEKSSESTAESSTQQSTSVEEEKPAEREHVELVMYNSINVMYQGIDETMEAVNAYLKEKLNTTLDVHYYTSKDYKSTIGTIFSSGTYMDIVLTGCSTLPFNENATRNAFVALDEYIDEYLPGTKAQLQESSWDAFTINDHVYGVPIARDSTTRYNFQANQTLMDDLGITFPETYRTFFDLEEFFYEAKKLRDAKYPEKSSQPLMKGLNSTLAAYYSYDELTKGVGTNIPGLSGFAGMGDGEKVFCPYLTDEYRTYAKFRNQLVKDNIIAFDSKNYDPDQVLKKNGDFLGETSVGTVYVDEDVFAPYYKTSFHPAQESFATTAGVQYGGFGIPATSKHVERALEVIELLNTDPYLATMMRFGPEGIGWSDENNDGVIELLGANTEKSAKNRYMYYFYGWNLGGLLVTKVPPTYPANFTELLKEMNDAGTPSPNLGFVLNTAPVANEIAACSNVIAEYDGVLQTGQDDNVDKLVDEFVDKLKANGIEKILEEAQTQLDTWRTAQGK